MEKHQEKDKAIRRADELYAADGKHRFVIRSRDEAGEWWYYVDTDSFVRNWETREYSTDKK